ncbi:MAG: host-nuclease inhibitor Gam family protein [Kiritimatiellae bacterium]|nr:host-nuclease inhibitor Gam family protein [Kiritimatiellia bacterium]
MKKKPTTTPIATRDDLESRMADYAGAAIKRLDLAAQMNAKLAEVRANYEAMFAKLDVSMQKSQADMQAWAVLHPAEFAAKKSLELVHGTLGFRTGQPALKPIKGVRWEDVQNILASGHRDYIRLSEEIAKDLILADRDSLGDDGLAALGLRVEQSERFFVDPKMEQTDCVTEVSR